MEKIDEKRIHVELQDERLRIINDFRRNNRDLFFYGIGIIILVLGWPSYWAGCVKPLMIFINGGPQLFLSHWLRVVVCSFLYVLFPFLVIEWLYLLKGIEEVVVAEGVLCIRRNLFGLRTRATSYSIESISKVMPRWKSRVKHPLEGNQRGEVDELIKFSKMGMLCFYYEGQTIRLLRGLKISEGRYLLEQLKRHPDFHEFQFEN